MEEDAGADVLDASARLSCDRDRHPLLRPPAWNAETVPNMTLTQAEQHFRHVVITASTDEALISSNLLA